MRRTPLTALAFAAAAALAPTSAAIAETIVTQPFRGVTHYTRTEAAGVVAPRVVVMNIVEINTADPGISFLTTPGNGAAPGEFTAQRTSTFVQQHNLQIGLNGDFFSPSVGTGPNGEIYRNVTNLAASNGELISPWPPNGGTARGALNISQSKTLTLVRPASSNAENFLTTPTLTPYNAIGGNQRMINNGTILTSDNTIHPRTCIGYKGTTLYLFTVDGRQPGYSEGMTLPEIANLMKNEYGVTHLLNLDGGGSTTLVMTDPNLRIVNRPSDGSERQNGNNFGVFAAHWPQWGIDNSGNWSLAANWVGGVPNGVGQVARFRNAITSGRTVGVDTPITVGSMEFEGQHTYTVAGAQLLTLDASVGNASLNINTSATQLITAAVKLNDTTDVTVAANGNFAFAGALNNSLGRTINKTGPGTLVVSGAQTHGVGAVLNVNQGTLSLLSNAGSASLGRLTLNANGGATRLEFNQHLNALNVGAAGLATITAGGPKTLKTKSLAIAAGGKLNVSDNDVILDYAAGASPLGSATGTTYSGVSGMIQTGRAGGAWNGPGIQSSLAASTGGLTAVAVGEASQVLGLSGTQTATWSGHAVDATSVLIMYTYAGDANMDGFVSGDDYTAIDFAISAPTAGGWTNGDFNYDGFISGDDYTLIDFSIVAQGGPFTNATSAAITSVPEPGAALGLALLCGLFSMRRSRAMSNRGFRV